MHLLILVNKLFYLYLKIRWIFIRKNISILYNFSIKFSPKLFIRCTQSLFFWCCITFIRNQTS